ncbi:putative retrotransposon hot spot protein (RHS,) [Trypanosoma cruzi]|uniref:Putative retrotransposon hot spot protein (RHS,) n=1 Tax=Trypanosoma cruzi TaxID=5693 RepID=A0A2V2V7X0_TRYCR|nr:putative retrotransposon hot spot protein (RHS,) [Trypanosoma cruzi]
MSPQQNEAFVFTMEGHYLKGYALGIWMANAMREGASWFFCAVRIAEIFRKKYIHIYTYIFPVRAYHDAPLLWRVFLGVCVWPWLQRILFPLLCVFSCVSGYVPTSSCRVSAVTAVPHGCGTVASGMRERTLRAHHVVIVGSHQHCAGWMVPARRRCGGPRASSTVPSHRAYGILVLAASNFCA